MDEFCLQTLEVLDNRQNKNSGEIKIGGFETVELHLSKSQVVYRCAISTKEDADLWLGEFCKLTRSQWIVKSTYPKAIRLAYHKKYVCAHNTKNKVPEGRSKRNLNCRATLNVKIKLLNYDTEKNDEFLRRQVPLRGIIVLTGEHNHNSDSAALLRFLRAPEEVREVFHGYFANGLGPGASIRFHKSTLLADEHGMEKLADGHFMPSPNTVHFWHKLWRQSLC